MKPEIASIHDRMSQGGDWLAWQKEIADLHAQASTEDEHVTLLEAHRKLVAVGEQVYDAEKYAELLPIARGEYIMFLNKEAMEDDLINPILLDRVTAREVQAGRLDLDDDFRKFAQAGGSVLGDSAELTAHSCRNGNWFFYGMVAASIAVWLVNVFALSISPLWLIAVGLFVGWFINERERKRMKELIAARRANSV